MDTAIVKKEIPKILLEAWAKESEARYKAYQKGEIKTIKGEKLIQELKSVTSYKDPE